MTVAGIYLLLQADFLAIVQILIYVGAISVLIIVAIMLTRDARHGQPLGNLKYVAGVIAFLLLAVIVYGVVSTPFTLSESAPLEQTIQPLGKALFGDGGYFLTVEDRGRAAAVGHIGRYCGNQGEMMFAVGLDQYIILSAVLFCIGLLGVLTQRNVIKVIMCLEIMLNAVNIALIAFSRYVVPLALTGQIFAIFVMVVAAAEVAVGIAIVFAIYRNKESVDMENFNILKW